MDAEEDSSSSSSSSPTPTSLLPPRPSGVPGARSSGRRGTRCTAAFAPGGGGSRWVCEVREPQAQARIWLGTYPTPEMAARAHDVAAIALRGARAAALLNFPDSAHALPRARTAAPEDIRCAAAKAAELYRPTTTNHQPLPEPAAASTTTCWAFLDEDAIFDMPGLIDDMARGMLLTPPAMGRDYYYLEDHVDCTLWMDRRSSSSADG